MSLRIGDTAPDFSAQSQQGEISLHKYLGDAWGILFSHPADFTPVCTTELGTVAKLVPEFGKRNTKVLALSVDPVDSHKSWISDINETQGVSISYPIIADQDRKISALYGMLDQTNLTQTGLPLTVRSVFVIDPSKKIRLIITYPASCGRNFDEILRALDSLQLTSGYNVVTPVNWKPGDDVIVPPTVTTEEAQKKYSDLKLLKPYLRYTKDPSSQ